MMGLIRMLNRRSAIIECQLAKIYNRVKRRGRITDLPFEQALLKKDNFPGFHYIEVGRYLLPYLLNLSEDTSGAYIPCFVSANP